MQNLQAKQKELIARRDELLQRLNGIKRDLGNGLSADFEEQAVQLENAEVLAEISRIANEELETVTQALYRIEQELARRN